MDYSAVFGIDRAPAQAAVLAQFEGFETLLREDTELEVDKGPTVNLNDLFAQLGERGIEVVSLRNKANRLEELFMRLVENKQDGFKEVAGT